MTFTVGVAQHLGLPDASFDVVTCVLAVHHIPARQRQAAFAEMYRITRPGGRLLTADLAPLLHLGGRPEPQAAAADPLRDLAAVAGYRVNSAGRLPLLRYIVAVRPDEPRG